MTRKALPNRREHESIEFMFRNQVFWAGVGRNTDGSLAEVFMQNEKIQNDLAHDNRDAFVVLSIALQHGIDPEVIRRACSRHESGEATGVVGYFLDLMQEGGDA
jgi:hypothetical protein